MDSVPLELLLECQNVSYRVLEDLRQLQQHLSFKEIVEGSNHKERIIELMNRRTLGEFDPHSLPPQLILEFKFEEDGNLDPVIVKAEDYLAEFDANISSKLPSPIWLRLLPTCLKLIRSMNLSQAEEVPKLRFISFAVEPILKSNRRYNTFVNINSCESRLEMPEGDFVTEKGEEFKSKSLNRALFGAFVDAGLNITKHQLPYVWWGIRFRTSHKSGKEDFINANWLDIRIPQEQFLGKEEFNDEVWPVQATISFPTLLASPNMVSIQSGLAQLYKDWAYDYIPSPLRESLPFNTPSTQLCAYVRLNQTSFPKATLPREGMDCLICPGVFWSVKSYLWGTGMTISYGFEGTIPEKLANLLLVFTQQLMIGPTLFSLTQKLWDEATSEAVHDVLHNLPKDLTAHEWALNNYLVEVQSFFDQNGKKCPENFPKLPKPDAIDVALMHLQASDMQETFLTELPIDLAEKLKGDWTITLLNEFIERVVWDQARQRAITLAKSKSNVTEPRGKPLLKLSPELIKLSETDGLYPIMLVTLRNAYQHACLGVLLDPVSDDTGIVEIVYLNKDEDDCLIVRNSGSPPNHMDAKLNPQAGWQRDTRLYKRFFGRWKIESDHEEFFSFWRESDWNGFNGYWETRIKSVKSKHES